MLVIHKYECCLKNYLRIDEKTSGISLDIRKPPHWQEIELKIDFRSIYLETKRNLYHLHPLLILNIFYQIRFFFGHMECLRINRNKKTCYKTEYWDSTIARDDSATLPSASIAHWAMLNRFSSAPNDFNGGVEKQPTRKNSFQSNYHLFSINYVRSHATFT